MATAQIGAIPLRNILLREVPLSSRSGAAAIDEGRKRVLLIAASILAARKLVNWDGRPSPALESGSWRGSTAGRRGARGRIDGS